MTGVSSAQPNFDAEGVLLLAHIPISGFPGNSATGNDCWGYVSPSGREYALMGLEDGIAVVEITDPIHPDIIGFIQGPNNLWHDIITGQHDLDTELSSHGVCRYFKPTRTSIPGDFLCN